jgi:hypothetical protein
MPSRQLGEASIRALRSADTRRPKAGCRNTGTGSRHSKNSMLKMISIGFFRILFYVH